MKFVNLQSFRVWLFVVVSLLSMSGTCSAEKVSHTKEGIIITVETNTQNEKTNVITVLANRSENVIAAYNLQTHSGAFHFKLLDADGNTVPQNPEWAKTYAQKESLRYKRPRSFSVVVVGPGEDTDFEFDLEDAYGENLRSGDRLEVSWESTFLGSTVLISDYKDYQGNLVKGGEKEYKFPPRWDISVTLPLGKTEQKNSKIAQSAAGTTSRSAALTNPMWWLLAIPLVILTWLGLRRTKKQK